LRKPKIIIFDMDGVITKIKNSWRYLHEYFTPGTDLDSVNTCKEKYIRGEISYARWMSCDIETLLKNARREIFKHEIINAYNKVAIYEEIKILIKEAISRGIKKYAIVSGGVSILARIAGYKLGIDEVYANHLIFDSRGALLPAGIPVVEPFGKGFIIRKILSYKGLDESEAVYIGDSIWDLPAFEVVEYPIAINCEECYRDPYKDKIMYVSSHKELLDLLFKNLLI